MGLYEDMLGRIQGIPNSEAFPELLPKAMRGGDAMAANAAAAREAYYQPYNSNMEPETTYTEEGVPVKSLKKKQMFPPLPPPPIQGMAAQAGILAPGMGIGGLPAAFGQPPAPPPEPEANPSPVAPGQVPLPALRPDDAPPRPAIMAADEETTQASPPVQLAPRQAAAVAAPESPFGLPSILDKIRTGLGNNSNTLLAIGAGFAGAPNIGQGISRAAAAAIPARAADIQQGLVQQSMQYGREGLRKMGVPEELINAAVSNPKIMDSVVQSYVTDRGKTFEKVNNIAGGQDIVQLDKYAKDGTPAMQRLDPDTGLPEVRPPPGSDGAVSYGDANPDRMLPAYNENGRDQAFIDALKKKSPIMGADVESALAGNFNGTGKNGAQVAKLAARADKNYDMNESKRRSDLRKSYEQGGEGFRAIRSVETTLKHAVDMKKAIVELQNNRFFPEYTNAIKNGLKVNFGDQDFQHKLGNFRARRDLLAKEADTALTGKPSTVTGAKEFKDKFSETAAEEQNLGALTGVLDMLNQRVDVHNAMFNKGLRPHLPNATKSGDVDLLSPGARAKMNGFLGQGPDEPAAPGNAAAAGAPAPIYVNPQTGQRITLRGGQWVPVP